MAKSKNKKRGSSQAGPPRAASKAATPRHRGLEFFRQRNYLEAARQWETLPLEDDAPLARALAEAHFRRALDAQGHPAAIDALRAALALAPDDARVLAHLALALHRQNQLEEAREFYARAMENDARPELQMARALCALEIDDATDLAQFTWLSPSVRESLEPIARLLRGQTLPDQWSDGDEAAALWRGLSALQQGDDEGARSWLARGKERALRAGAQQMSAFYGGVAAARLGKSVAALEEWNEAAQIARKAKIEPLAQIEGGGGSPVSRRDVWANCASWNRGICCCTRRVRRPKPRRRAARLPSRCIIWGWNSGGKTNGSRPRKSGANCARCWGRTQGQTHYNSCLKWVGRSS